MISRLRAKLAEERDAYLDALKGFVACDTQVIGHGVEGGREASGQEYLERLFKTMGAASVERDAMEEAVIEKAVCQHREGNLGHVYDNRYNLYARFSGRGDKTLMFNGHVDTMPPGDTSLWHTPPHVPTVSEGKLYGLGACDMKGGLMAAIMAVELIHSCGYELPVNVAFTAVVDEEGGGNGSLQAVMRGQRADGVVVCEPTDDQLILAHMGFVFFRIGVKGRANHSGAKWLGVSAIEKSLLLIERLMALDESWRTAYNHPLLPAPSLNVGTIEGGTAASTVAPTCTFEVCVHYVPGQMCYESVVEAVTEALKAEDDWLVAHPPTVEVYQAGGAFEMPEASTVVSAFKAAYQSALDREVVVAGSPAGCDARLWRNIADCPTVQFGPGRLEQCHAIDEYIEIEAYLESILVYAALILDFDRDKGD